MVASRAYDLEIFERFRSTCSWCRNEADLVRAQMTERYAFLSLKGPRTGLVQHRVICEACGGEQHVRDLTSLDSPMLAQQYEDALRSGIAALDLAADERSARSAAVTVIQAFDPDFDDGALDAERVDGTADRLDEGLASLRDNCHSSIHRRWLAALMYVVDQLTDRAGEGNGEGDDLVARSARALYLSERDVIAARSLVDRPEGRDGTDVARMQEVDEA